MVGGTNGAHLTSFSLVDILSHGRACAIMNPYYTVFFAPAIQRHLTGVAGLLERYGLMNGSDPRPAGRALGEAVARGLILFARRVDFPATLGEVKGMTDGHLRKALTAAKNPQLKMKLQNMPVPLTADQVDEYMGPILQAGKSGDFSLIRNLES